LPACKNIGVTHITNGAYRLHPVEWNIGEVAGALAAFSMDKGIAPGTIPGDQALLRSFQRTLLRAGVPLFWWVDVPVGSAYFDAAHLVGIAGIMSGDGTSLDFRPSDLIDEASRAAINDKLGRDMNWPGTPMTRAQAAQWIVQQLGW
jgi:hypothetical protein